VFVLKEPVAGAKRSKRKAWIKEQLLIVLVAESCALGPQLGFVYCKLVELEMSKRKCSFRKLEAKNVHFITCACCYSTLMIPSGSLSDSNVRFESK
jgi:hypothetical protein